MEIGTEELKIIKILRSYGLRVLKAVGADTLFITYGLFRKFIVEKTDDKYVIYDWVAGYGERKLGVYQTLKDALKAVKEEIEGCL